jgi:hypothetical protein
MNVEIGAEAAQFLEKEKEINGIFLAVHTTFRHKYQDVRHNFLVLFRGKVVYVQICLPTRTEESQHLR